MVNRTQSRPSRAEPFVSSNMAYLYATDTSVCRTRRLFTTCAAHEVEDFKNTKKVMLADILFPHCHLLPDGSGGPTRHSSLLSECTGVIQIGGLNLLHTE